MTHICISYDFGLVRRKHLFYYHYYYYNYYGPSTLVIIKKLGRTVGLFENEQLVLGI